MFTKLSRLRVTHVVHMTQIAHLDLWMLKEGSRLITKTHQKALNLYLYIPANSAHSPGILKGLIYGLLKKYKSHNSRPADFRRIVNLFYKRLQARGYLPKLLLPVFRKALSATTFSPSLHRSPSSTSSDISPMVHPVQWFEGYYKSENSKLRSKHRLRSATPNLRHCNIYFVRPRLGTPTCPLQPSLTVQEASLKP